VLRFARGRGRRVADSSTSPAGPIPPAGLFLAGAGPKGRERCETAKALLLSGDGSFTHASDRRPRDREEGRGARGRATDLSGPSAGAVPGESRIEALDALRGFALLGIFVMNLPAFGRSVLAPPRSQDLATLDGAVGFAR
jgi:hypothetical protein